MTILKILRKPYLATFLSLLILFVSCTPSNEFNNELTTLNEVPLEKTIIKHIQISEKLSFLLEKEKDIDFEILDNMSKKLNNYDDLEKVLIKSNITEYKATSLLLKEMQENMNELVNYYVKKNKLNEEEITKIVTNEIDRLLKGEKTSDGLQTKSDNCIEECARRWVIATDRCKRNWYISNGAVAVAGFFSLGIGTLIGATAAGGVALLCQYDANSDRDDCYSNCAQ